MCKRCRVSGCGLNYLGDACKRARQKECPDVKYTNSDKLRDMDDEELANFLNSVRPNGIVWPWLEWLQMGVEE